MIAFNTELERMKSIAQEQKMDEKLHFKDFSEYKYIKMSSRCEETNLFSAI